jgi:hypothetical protein
MIQIAKKSLVLALLAGIGFAATAQERVYVIDQRDVVAKSGFGLCWRTGYWTPAAAAKDPAGCECDKDLIPKEVCEPKAAAPAAAPVAAPKVAKGIEANRVYTEGKGEKQPVTGDKCKGEAKTKALIDCLQPDRRADIELIGTKK